MYATPAGVDPNFQPVTFEQLLASNHSAFVKVTLEDATGASLATGLTVTGGEIVVDRTAQTRRVATLQVAPVTPLGNYVPGTPSDALSPYGNVLRAWYGLVIPGTVDPTYWSLGVYRLSTVTIADDPVPALSVTAYDFSRTISRNKLTNPWVVAAGANWGDTIIALALDRFPALQYRAHSVTAVAPASVIDPEADPWQTITDWAASFGSEVYFDTDGYLVIAPEPDVTTAPVTWTYADSGNGKNAALVSADRSLSDEPGYNGVIVTTESAQIPVPLRGEAWDLNPSSPTYSLGPYGKVPKFVSNPYAATQAQVDAVASAELLRSMGGTEQLGAAVVPNPAHEAGDVLRFSRPASKIEQTTVLEGFTFPLGPGSPMVLNLRERRTIA